MNLVEELFSAGLMDKDGCRCGRVDDVLVEPVFDRPPRVTALLSGRGTKSRLMAPWAHKLSIHAHRLLGMRGPVTPAIIPWDRVKLINDHVGLAARARELGLDALNRAAARRWISRIPGGGRSDPDEQPSDGPSADSSIEHHGLSLESLTGRRLHDSDGRPLGRICSFTAQWQHGDLYVTAACIGVGAWVELLWPDDSVRRLLTTREPVQVPWQAIEPAGMQETHTPVRLRG